MGSRWSLVVSQGVYEPPCENEGAPRLGGGDRDGASRLAWTDLQLTPPPSTHHHQHSPLVVLLLLLQGIPSLGVSGRKLWYIWGTAIVLVCFMGVFAFDPFGYEAYPITTVTYFAICASLFNVRRRLFRLHAYEQEPGRRRRCRPLTYQHENGGGGQPLGGRGKWYKWWPQW